MGCDLMTIGKCGSRTEINWKPLMTATNYANYSIKKK